MWKELTTFTFPQIHNFMRNFKGNFSRATN